MNFAKTIKHFDSLFTQIRRSRGFIFMDLQSFCRTIIDEKYKKLFQSKDLYVYADGFFVNKILKSKGVNYQPGPDFFLKILNNNNELLILGPSDDDISIFKEKLVINKLSIKVDSLELPMVNCVNELDINYIIEKINNVKSKIIIVILGCPKQEILIAKLIKKVENKLFFGLGAAFNFYINKEIKAPKIITYLRLEWIFRLFISPKKQLPKYNQIFKAVFIILSSKLDRLLGKFKSLH